MKPGQSPEQKALTLALSNLKEIAKNSQGLYAGYVASLTIDKIEEILEQK